MNVGGADVIVDGEWIENPDLLRGAMKYAKVLHERAFDTSRWLQNLRETPWREKVSDGTRGIAYPGWKKVVALPFTKIITIVEGVSCKGEAERHIVSKKFWENRECTCRKITIDAIRGICNYVTYRWKKKLFWKIILETQFIHL
ncbi:unnamed protein product [Lasius platythorax]|uniref:Uncharacterized protein n=1 Tax=Lasius platythorax TaxID=488582 RepID=A0AAV2N6N8_9HYME